MYVLHGNFEGPGMRIHVVKTYPMMILGPLAGCRRVEVDMPTLQGVKNMLGAGPYYMGGVRTALFVGGIHYAG